MTVDRFLLATSLFATLTLLPGCGKSDAELTKKAEQLGEEMGNKLVVDMVKKQLADAKDKHARNENAHQDCLDLARVEYDVKKDKSAEGKALLKDIHVFCELEVGLARHVASIKESYDKMLGAQKEKDRSFEQLYWAGFTSNCNMGTRAMTYIEDEEVKGDARAKELKSQIEQMCTPENLERKKYFK
ncbi:hypothetical protein LVJ94_33980 [Pendulispora rubella]|uniref:Lipoprotein n=1 Tax=Pendulispora rubella TaxID=2741070 RepID=A0ABZ2KTC5_9BACT